MRRPAAHALLAAAALAVALPTRAHEVLHEVERGRAVAVRVHYPDGEGLAYVEAEVFSPADGRIPHWKGRTDRNGWVSFVPDVPGKWRVRVVDSTGHGLDTVVDVPSPGTTAAAGEAADPERGARGPSTGVQLRPLTGVAVIAVVFGLLFLFGRARRR
ncbi:MAG TPA: hypothetical protein PLL32_03320 [Anaeromyxobacteraceae bacterium]|nr:hypothetical protein [Anaeromyxobacteraceae bacterium]